MSPSSSRTTDTGSIAEFLPHVFERFRQQDSSTTRESPGLGLGLSIAKHLVELHGGTIGAFSDGEGTGATFVVEFPPVKMTRRSGDRSRDELAGWLEEHGLGKYAGLFEAHDIDLPLLPHLTEDDVDRLQLPTGARRRLLVAIQDLRDGGTAARPPIATAAAPLSQSAERRQLTVLFCDLVGSTALSQRIDPESLGELMRGYQRVCEAVIEQLQRLRRPVPGRRV